jgi:hypothetical protein
LHGATASDKIDLLNKAVIAASNVELHFFILTLVAALFAEN